MLKKVLPFLLVIFCFSCISFAQTFPQPHGFFNDFAGMTSPEFRSKMEKRLVEFEKKTQVEIGVAIVDSLDGNSIEGYANDLFREWGIGKKEVNNGILFLIVKGEKKMRFEVGYALEPYLPDSTCKQILREKVTPQFKKGDYTAGIEAGVQAVINKIGEISPEERKQQLEKSGPIAVKEFDWGLWMGPIIFLVILITIVLVVFPRRRVSRPINNPSIRPNPHWEGQKKKCSTSGSRRSSSPEPIQDARKSADTGFSGPIFIPTGGSSYRSESGSILKESEPEETGKFGGGDSGGAGATESWDSETE